MPSLILKASNIFHDLQQFIPDDYVLSDSSIDMIKKNISNDELAEFYNDVMVMLKIYRNYKMKKEKPVFPAASAKVAYTLLRFLVNPMKYITSRDEKQIDTEDPTHSKLQKEVLKLGISMIKHDMLEYDAAERHLRGNRRRDNELIY